MPPVTLRIVYVGQLQHGGTCRQRLEALERLGHEVMPIDTRGNLQHRRVMRLASRVASRFGRPLDVTRASDSLLAVVTKVRPHVVWLDKPLTIRPSVLATIKEAAPATRLLGYSPDDMYARHNQSQRFLACLPYFDCFFTTKSYGVDELKQLGARNVVFVGNAYDPATHVPIDLSDADRVKLGGDVGFVGAWEPERARSMEYLASRGVPVRWWCGGIRPRQINASPHVKLEARPVWQRDYAATINAFHINLGFLRKINRDLQTTRSVEIPACGAFMLAERTNEHLALFEEGKEAEFFGSDEELLEKASYYLANPDLRKKIAAAGRERCLKSGYSNDSRLAWMLARVWPTG